MDAIRAAIMSLKSFHLQASVRTSMGDFRDDFSSHASGRLADIYGSTSELSF